MEFPAPNINFTTMFTSRKKSVLAIATGGTGGHFYPALSIALAARRNELDPVLVIAGHNLEKHIEIAHQNDIRAIPAKAPRLPESKLAMPAFAVKFLLAMLAAQRVLRNLRPICVLGMGSFASVPLCLTASSKHLPLLLHEGNAILGRANRFLAPFARETLLSLPLRNAPMKRPTFRTGFPLRPQIVAAAHSMSPRPEQAKGAFGFNSDTPVLLSFGGSQGATFLNSVVPEAMKQIRANSTMPQILHLAGSVDEQTRLQTLYAEAGVTACVLDRTEDMASCYRAADLVLCRAGGATIAELALFKKPAILVPFPAATDDHQTANAQSLADRRAAMHIPQQDATPPRLAVELDQLIRTPDARNYFAAQIANFANPDAADSVIERIRNHVVL